MGFADPRVDTSLCRDYVAISDERLEVDSEETQTYPATPSLPMTWEIPEKVPLNSGGIVVCVRTLTASNGHRATSAMNSADALAARYTEVFHLWARSGPTRSE
jgi:hypothetical protein